MVERVALEFQCRKNWSGAIRLARFQPSGDKGSG
jgi:hypothetical protein